MAKLTASDAYSDDNFGISVAIDGNTIVVGAYYENSSNLRSVYVFRTTDGGATYVEVAKLTASDGANTTTSATPWRSPATPSCGRSLLRRAPVRARPTSSARATAAQRTVRWPS